LKMFTTPSLGSRPSASLSRRIIARRVFNTQTLKV
jgi:hypothetical protein